MYLGIFGLNVGDNQLQMMHKLYQMQKMPQIAQIPSPSFSFSSAPNQNVQNDKIDKMLSSIEQLNYHVLQIKQQQASTINSLNVLTHDVLSLNDEMKKIKVQHSTKNNSKPQRGRRGKSRSTRTSD